MKKICLKERINKDFKCKGIYKIIIGEHLYIGSSKNIQTRLADHRKSLNKKVGVNSKLQNAFDKYGIENVFCEILEVCNEVTTTKELLAKEETWIKILTPDLNICLTPTTQVLNYCNSQIRKTRKKIYQYDLDGNYLNEFSCAKEAQSFIKCASANLLTHIAGRKKEHAKSAYGYLWSYEKMDRIKPYTNYSSKAKIASINVLNLETLEESQYESIAEFVKQLNVLKFDSECAIVSDHAHKGGIYQLKYLIKYGGKYKFRSRKIQIFNTRLNKYYNNAKEAAIDTKLNRNTIRSYCQNASNSEWQYVEDIARQKFRESGKLYLIDNPNPSTIET